MRYMIRIGAIVAITFGVLGCGPSSMMLPADQEWLVTEWSRGPAPKMTVVITSDTIHGQAPCNRFSGNFTAAHPNNVTIGPLAVTRMTCPDISIETAILNDLSRMIEWSLVKSQLHLRGPDGLTLTLAPR
mgnify:CR=1 FL=1